LGSTHGRRASSAEADYKILASIENAAPVPAP